MRAKNIADPNNPTHDELLTLAVLLGSEVTLRLLGHKKFTPTVQELFDIGLDNFCEVDKKLLLADAIELADSAARADIECNLPMTDDSGEALADRWYDTQAEPEENAHWLPQAIRYLEARGLLVRRPDAPHCVQVVGGK